MSLGWSRGPEERQATEHGSMALRSVALRGAAPAVPSCLVSSSSSLAHDASGNGRVPQTLAPRPPHPRALSLRLLPILSCLANPPYSSSLTVTPLPPGGLPRPAPPLSPRFGQGPLLSSCGLFPITAEHCFKVACLMEKSASHTSWSPKGSGPSLPCPLSGPTLRYLALRTWGLESVRSEFKPGTDTL